MGRIITHDLSNLRAGEDDVLHLLAKELPDDWDLACTLAIPGGEDGRELDVVAISDRGIWLLEVKHHFGHLDISSGALAKSGKYLENPYYQVDGAAKVLADYLKKKSPELRAVGHKPVHGHLVFSNRDARLIRVEDEIAHQVSTIDTVGADLLDRHERSSLDISTSRERLRNVLSSTRMRDVVPPKILSWALGERLSTSRSVRTFHATHDDGSEYVLRLLRPANSLDRDFAKRQRDGLLREYETLRQLSALDVCPTVQSYVELDEGEYLVPIQAVEGRSLAQEIADGVAPEGDRVREVVAAAFRALAIVHEAEPAIVHRAITPERVVISPNGTVRFTDFQVAHIDERTGLTTVLADIDPDEPNTHYWRAPEARQNLAYASSHSDVWSLATTLRAWVLGSVRSGDLKKDTLPGEVRVRLGDVADAFVDLLREARVDAAGKRPSSRTIADAWGPVEEPQTLAVSEVEALDEAAIPLCHREIELGDLIEGRYQLIERLGAGATAVTYLVRDVEVDEHVVLKSFDFEVVPENLALQEFKKAKRLTHERIATVREFHRPSHPYHLVVDHAAGHEVDTHSERFVGDADAVLALANSLLEGLGYIHDKGYLHRDVSPRNIIVSDDDPADLKLIDFGLAALRSDSTSRSFGTFPYVAPEILRGNEWTPAADVYSAGVVLFQALTGDVPFAMEPAPVHDDLVRAPTRWGPRVRSLAELFLTAVQPDPASRFPDAGEFLSALHEMEEQRSDVPDEDVEMAAESDGEPFDSEEEEAAPPERPTSSWLTGLVTLEDQLDLDSAVEHDVEPQAEPPAASAPVIEVREPAADLDGDGSEPDWFAQPSFGGTLAGLAPELKVVSVPDSPTRPRGNCTFGIGRTRKYSLGLDETVRGVVASSGRERTVYASVPDEFVAMVNAAKAAGGQSEGGSFVIDHTGNVLVGSGGAVWLAGRVEGLLQFEDGARILTPQPDDDLEPGAPWGGLGVGLRYKLNASTSDIAHETPTGAWEWLSDHVGADRAHAVASAMGRIKRGGGRVYINEAGAAFGPVQVGHEWREVYLGRIPMESWFS